MDDFFSYDPLSAGSKGLVFIGDEILVYRRDDNTDNHPQEIDLPGGGPEGEESPFETFQREVREEFGLTIKESDIVYVRKYASTTKKDSFGYFPVAKLPAMETANIAFGEEGSSYELMSLDTYLGLKDAWSVFQERAANYKSSRGQ